MARSFEHRKASATAARRLCNLSTRQRVMAAVLAMLVLGVCFALERTGIMDSLLNAAGVTNSMPIAADGVLEAHVLDVGNADAIFVTCDGVNLLIDAGERSGGDTVVDYLTARGVTKLDYVMATHADYDHIGGMKTVIEQFEIGSFLMAYMPQGAEPTTATYYNMLVALEEKNLAVTDVVPGTEYPLGEAVMTILGPVADANDTNEQSIVCRIQHGDQRLLFTGDAGREEEETLLDAGADLQANFVKVGHHGSRNSSTEAFLQAVGAQYAVISCGADNEYGHPHEETLKRLASAGITVWRTDRHGTVTVSSDGASLTVTVENGES